LIAVEPTSALDVSVQAQILELLAEIRDESRAAIICISHDMGAIGEICDRVAVMYAGRVVEVGGVEDVLHRTAHPYTTALLSAIPPLAPDPSGQLRAISGSAPLAGSWPGGFKVRHLLNDLNLSLAYGADLGVQLRGVSLVRELTATADRLFGSDAASQALYGAIVAASRGPNEVAAPTSVSK
jgi:ABC-type glutathione transport system ATPase component